MRLAPADQRPTLGAGGAELLIGALVDRGEHGMSPMSRTQTRPRRWRPHLARVLTRHSPPLWLGIVVAAVVIVTETLLVQFLGRLEPRMSFGAVYLLGVLIISFGWGIGLAVVTTLVSAAVYLEVHLAGNGLLPDNPRDLVALAVFVPIALLANVLGAQARLRAAEARRAARQVSELARRQAALRRVATLVARGVSPSEIFAAVADEVANALEVGNATLFRYLDVDFGEIVAAYDEGAKKMPVGAQLTLEGDNVAALVQRTGATARMDSHEGAAGSTAAMIRHLGFRSGVGAPIIVDGRLWGAAIVGFTRPEPPPPDTEERLTDFAELVATAVANAEARGRADRFPRAHRSRRRRGQAAHRARPARRSTTTPCRPGIADSVSTGLAAS